MDDGWPLVNEKALQRWAANRVNFTIMRLGPFLAINGDGTRGGPPGYAETVDHKYDLNRWDPAFWTRVKEALTAAQTLGITVEVDIVDGWALKHGGDTSPWAAWRNLQGEEYASCETLRKPPAQRILDWTRKVVEETGPFTNVTYEISNESFACGVQPVFELGIAGIVRTVEQEKGFVRHLIATNSQRADLESTFDYAERHASEAQEAEAFPVNVNEFDVDSLSPDVFAVELGAAIRRGTHFAIWRGQQDEAEWSQSLAFIKRVAEGNIPTVPESCPPLAVWGVKRHSLMNSRFQIVEAPEVGGYVTWDSTPLFADGSGRSPCNAEHAGACQGRKCEPKFGPDWRVEGPIVPQKLESNGFMMRMGPLVRGTYSVKTCAPNGVTDQEQPPKPLDVANAGCGSARIEVQ